MIDKSKIESMGLLDWLEKETSIYVYREDDNYWYVWLKERYEEVKKQENAYEILKKIVKAYQPKVVHISIFNTHNSILKLISEKLPEFMTKEICVLAVKNNGASLHDVPKDYVDYEMCLSAVENCGYAIQYVPEQYLTESFIKRAVCLHPESLRYVPKQYLSEERCFEFVKDNVRSYEYIPSEFQSKRIIDFVVNIDPKLIVYVSNEDLDNRYFPRIDKNAPCALPKIDSEKSESIFPKSQEGIVVYDLTNSDTDQMTIYYISDIHLEHQLDLVGKSICDIRNLIAVKVDEMISKINDRRGMLLIGGDIADNKILVKIFFQKLQFKWHGKIVYVLGNHELWDSDLGDDNRYSIDRTIEQYRSFIRLGFNIGLGFILENELLLEYKGASNNMVCLSESNILKTSKEDLTEICEKSTKLILGGIGFAGMNMIYNADAGIYRQVVSREEERERSRRFKAVYDKVLACAKNLPVIVLTHMPMRDWSDAEYNPNWIYLNGHTHINTLIRESDGTTVFADNQMGYKPRIWNLNGFNVDKKIYDPFKDYQDGRYKFDENEYYQFSRGRGIRIYGTKCLTEKMYFIKRGEYYMFLLYNKDDQLRLLEGAKPKVLTRKMEYYEENFGLYIDKVHEILSPYQNALKAIAEEVKKFGGNGIIHGSIVDIDFFNHIYLNPLDGKITPYYATDMIYKQIYPNVEELLLNSPYRGIIEERKMLTKFMKLLENRDIAILSDINDGAEKRVIPEIVLNTDMYRQSRIMKSFQYIFDKKVLRRWDDAILNYDPKATKKLLNGNDDK